MYCGYEAFRCIHSEVPFQISRLIPAHNVKSAEECVWTRNGHSETSISVCMIWIYITSLKSDFLKINDNSMLFI